MVVFWVQVVYFHKEECPTITDLKAFFEEEKVDAKFFKKLNHDILSLVRPSCTIVVFDDYETDFSSRSNADLLYKLASIYCHHSSLNVFFLIQSVGPLKKDNLANKSVIQSSHFVFFKSSYDSRSLKHFLNNFDIRLKGGMSVYEVFEKYIQKSGRFCYLVLSVSPRLSKNAVLTNFLLGSEGVVRTFQESDSEDE